MPLANIGACVSGNLFKKVENINCYAPNLQAQYNRHSAEPHECDYSYGFSHMSRLYAFYAFIRRK